MLTGVWEGEKEGGKGVQKEKKRKQYEGGNTGGNEVLLSNSYHNTGTSNQQHTTWQLFSWVEATRGREGGKTEGRVAGKGRLSGGGKERCKPEKGRCLQELSGMGGKEIVGEMKIIYPSQVFVGSDL